MVCTKGLAARRKTWQSDICSAINSAMYSSVRRSVSKGKVHRLEVRIVSSAEVFDVPVVREQVVGVEKKKEELCWVVEEYVRERDCAEYKWQFGVEVFERGARVGLDWFDMISMYRQDRPVMGRTLHELLACSEDDLERDHLVRVLLDQIIVSDPGEEVVRVLLGRVEKS